jgi:lipoyl(octanoyl) transferase
MVQQVLYTDLGRMEYKNAWDLQEQLMKENVEAKVAHRTDPSSLLQVKNYLLFVEHPPVYTLGKSGNPKNVLLSDEQLASKGISFFHTDRGGDITFHGEQQVVGYPILDLEQFYTDIGRYLRDLEEVIIRTCADYGIHAERSGGETGVWIEPDRHGHERKICAMGVRTSRWITMHGFAFNVNTDLTYFNNIIPCGIANKKVTSLKNELRRDVDLDEVKAKLRLHFAEVFNVKIIATHHSQLISSPQRT